MTGIFRLSPISEGSNPDDWDTVDELLSEADEPIEPDASYQEQAEVVPTLGGGGYARGFATATWLLSGVTPAQKYTLRQICPGVSAPVYIETPTNSYDSSGDRIFIQAAAIMHWPTGEDDIQADITTDLEIIFTELVEIEE